MMIPSAVAVTAVLSGARGRVVINQFIPKFRPAASGRFGPRRLQEVFVFGSYRVEVDLCGGAKNSIAGAMAGTAAPP
jgi:hypothetical protein